MRWAQYFDQHLGVETSRIKKYWHTTNLLSRDDEAFVEQPVLDQEQLLDVVLRPKAMAGQASHLQQNVNVLEG